MLHPEFLVYVAAPFSPTAKQKARVASAEEPDFAPCDAVKENAAAAAALGLRVAELGAMPLVPHTAHGGRPELESVQDYDFWIKGTAAYLFRCDAALFAPNWQESNGARGEHAKCEEWGIPIFYTIAALADWLSGSPSLPPEAIEAVVGIAWWLTRIAYRCVDTERPIPYRLPSELPSPSKYPTTDATFGRLPRASNVPDIPEYLDDGDDGNA